MIDDVTDKPEEERPFDWSLENTWHRGGRFALTTLIQKRLVELNRERVMLGGSSKYVNNLQKVLDEIDDDKISIELGESGPLRIDPPTADFLMVRKKPVDKDKD